MTSSQEEYEAHLCPIPGATPDSLPKNKAQSMQIAAKLKGLVTVAAIAVAMATPAQADQIGQFIQLASTPTFTFSGLGTAGGSIVGTDIKPGLFLDAIDGNNYSASTNLNLQYLGGDTYKGVYSIIATAASGTIAVGDILFAAAYTATLSGGNGSLGLNNVVTNSITSQLYTGIPFSDTVTGFTFTNVSSSIATNSLPVTGSGSGNGSISISTTLVSVPEPASMVMLGLGMLGPIALRARRASKV
jgi:hypothetical protein